MTTAIDDLTARPFVGPTDHGEGRITFALLRSPPDPQDCDNLFPQEQ